MDALALIDVAAARFRRQLLDEPACHERQLAYKPPPNPAVAWENLLLESPKFRHAHVETFAVPGRLSVLHVCIFPQLDDPAPIYGFDMIAGPARVTGMFLDLSPVLPGPPLPRLPEVADAAALARFAAPRSLPDWGDIFSSDVLAIRPADLDEVAQAIALAHQALDGLLSHPRVRSRNPGIAEGQARYIAGQRRNEHTARMLAGFVGAEPARRFIDEVLFPSVPVTA